MRRACLRPGAGISPPRSWRSSRRGGQPPRCAGWRCAASSVFLTGAGLALGGKARSRKLGFAFHPDWNQRAAVPARGRSRQAQFMRQQPGAKGGGQTRQQAKSIIIHIPKPPARRPAGHGLKAKHQRIRKPRCGQARRPGPGCNRAPSGASGPRRRTTPALACPE